MNDTSVFFFKIKSLREKYLRQSKHNKTSGINHINIERSLEETFGVEVIEDAKPLESLKRVISEFCIFLFICCS